MSNQDPNLRPNVPSQFPGLDAMPSLGTPVQQKPLTREMADAADQTIPRVPLQVPTWFQPSMSTAQAPSAEAVSTEAQASTPTPQFQTSFSPSLAPQQAPVQQAPQFSEPQPTAQPQAYWPPQSAPEMPYVAAETARQANTLASVPKPVPGSTPGTVRAPSGPTQHPVVNALLNDLGYTDAKTATVQINGADGSVHKFKLRELPTELFAHIMTIVGNMKTTNDVYSLRLSLTIAAASVISIDDEPVYEVAGIDVSKAGKFNDNNPPFSITAKTTIFLIDLFFNQLPLTIVSQIADAYEKNYSSKNIDADILAQAGVIGPDDKRMKFICSVDGCDHSEDVIPEFTNGDSIKARYCPEHGATMSPIGWLKDLANAPLA